MSSKDKILDRCRAAVKERYDMPSLDDLNPITWENTLAQFVSMTEQSGGKAVMVPEGGDINAIIKELFPEAAVIASNLPEISIANLNPDTADDAAALERTDVGIVRGTVGVAENGCIWVPQAMKEKAVCFICEHLVIVLSKDAVVNNMHEAYKKIEFNDYGYGTFISGPSKTADIAQVLVMGAQAARSVTVLIC